MNFIDKHAIWLNGVCQNRIDSNLHGDTNLVKTNKQTNIYRVPVHITPAKEKTKSS